MERLRLLKACCCALASAVEGSHSVRTDAVLTWRLLRYTSVPRWTRRLDCTTPTVDLRRPERVRCFHLLYNSKPMKICDGGNYVYPYLDSYRAVGCWLSRKPRCLQCSASVARTSREAEILNLDCCHAFRRALAALSSMTQRPYVVHRVIVRGKTRQHLGVHV
jgi:hypothetical protein